MSAAERARLGAVATALLAGDGPDPRAAALSRHLSGRPRQSVTLDDLATAPAWLVIEPAARRRLGRRAALGTIAPLLSASIDGEWLGGLARIAGDDNLDWAMSLGDHGGPRLDRFGAADLDAVAEAILMAAAPPALQQFIDTRATTPFDPAVASAALALAA